MLNQCHNDVTLNKSMSSFWLCKRNQIDIIYPVLEGDNQYVPQTRTEELFCIPDSVQIFFISESGQVSTFSETSTLRLFRIGKGSFNWEGNDVFVISQNRKTKLKLNLKSWN